MYVRTTRLRRITGTAGERSTDSIRTGMALTVTWVTRKMTISSQKRANITLWESDADMPARPSTGRVQQGGRCHCVCFAWTRTLITAKRAPQNLQSQRHSICEMMLGRSQSAPSNSRLERVTLPSTEMVAVAEGGTVRDDQNIPHDRGGPRAREWAVGRAVVPRNRTRDARFLGNPVETTFLRRASPLYPTSLRRSFPFESGSGKK